MTTNTKEIKPCPWCQGTDFTNLIVALNYRQRSCNKCSARGPVVKIKTKGDDFLDDTELDLFWNDRPSEKKLEIELLITDKLLDSKIEVLNIIPPCPVHGGGCTPHYSDWIESAKELMGESYQHSYKLKCRKNTNNGNKEIVAKIFP